MNAFGREVNQALAGRAHRAAYPSVKKSAAIHGHHISTEHRWGQSGPPALLQYIDKAPNKWALEAHVKVLAMQQTVDRWTVPELLQRFRDLRADIARAEANLIEMEVEGASQIDLAAADERLSSLHAERSAARRRMARERITQADVWGR